MRGLRTAAAIAIACALGGCQAGIFREWSMDGGSSLSLDASQRLVFVTERGGRNGDRRVVCAEPSPDSITSLAATLSASGGANSDVTRPAPVRSDGAAGDGTAAGTGGTITSKQAVQAGISAAYGENAAYVGMRTQTIQLLRDGLFRACEAYMNGAIDETQYNLLLVNMPRTMAALVAMDGLTARPSAPPFALGAPTVSALVTPAAAGAPQSGGAPAPISESKVTNNTQNTITIQPNTVNDKASDAVRDIALSMTEHQTVHSACMAIMASNKDPHQIYDQHFEAVAAMCRQLFKGLPEIYAWKAKQEAIRAAKKP
ncbi:hypothetical protein [Prosthecodimorpha staleyi]|uniref:Uncharacterized protein n=1 Tax=Prosthecodimorpha staleyi TaxID=2840188 RepID=A0A947DAX7_9HYPH|nr:hypothetical protein [Prosthecodimorpha staleyi]MBT9290564.1 hypothetical protein [Prosthecodimorpha staleyi]